MNSKFLPYVMYLLIPFGLFLIFAYVLVFHYGFMYGDALSRSFHAYSVFWGNTPKLSAIGFVEPPLPTIAELFLVILKPLNSNGFAGNIASCLIMSASSFFLYKFLTYFKLSIKEIILFILLYITNPMILFYAINGMSESFGIFFLIAALYYFIQYIRTKKIVYVATTSILVSSAIMSRFEMIVLIPICIVILLIQSPRQFWNIRKIKKIESTLILFLTPIFFTICIWLIVSWLIVYDPFYFMKSTYSNTAQTKELLTWSSSFQMLQNNALAVALYVMQRIIMLYPAFLISAFFLVITLCVKKSKSILILTLLAAPFALIFFHSYLLFKGQSFGWLRFFIYIIPCSFLFTGYLLSLFSRKKKLHYLVLSICIIVHVISSISSVYAMATPEIGKEEYPVAEALLNKNVQFMKKSSTYKQTQLNKYITDYIRNHIHNTKILIDDFTGFEIVYFSQNPHLFVETIDQNFLKIVHNPLGYSDIGYILVPNNKEVGLLDAINKYYPSIYRNGLSYTTLEKDFGEWRLYKIVR